MDRERLKYWLALGRGMGRVRGVERTALKEAVEEAKDAKDIFSGKGGRGGRGNNPAVNIARRLKRSDWEWVERELDLIEEHGVTLLTIKDGEYPEPLRHIHNPPLFLYLKGTPYDRELPVVAVVGTRRATHYGLRMAAAVSRDLARAGVVVISGMARGCDSAAHRGALDGGGGGGKTAAVLGTGIDRVYPGENEGLYNEIAAKGLLISEFPFGTPPLAQNFPRRNRIISGLALGVLVVEAPARSGAMMTARLALDEGREVFSLPGKATSEKSAGANKLIKDGASLVENADDILNALSLAVPERKPERPAAPAADALGPEGSAIMALLGDEPLHIDRIAERAGMPVQKASATLLEMELKGFVEQQPGKLFFKKF
ncbi:MAG: DNA-processing protein DprA [Thermodesulfobacteriota bacterium]